MEFAMTSAVPQISLDADDAIRHCALCLKELIPSIDLIKKCGKCKKRVYCSGECQSKDWSVTGQRHKNWCCRYEYGEEDIDWRVLPVPFKGLGVLAKRFLRAGKRIIVEPVYSDPNDHPGINDLEPKGGSLEEKFKLYCIGENKDCLSLRISRVNHSCRPNACCSYDEVAQVAILYALKDIQPGEEICVSYCSFARLDQSRPNAGLVEFEMEFVICRMTLKAKWGITCPPDCFCKDPGAKKLILEGRRLNDDIKSAAAAGSIEGLLRASEKKLDIEVELNMSWNEIAKLGSELYCIALMRKKTFPKAYQFLKDIQELNGIIRPHSKYTATLKGIRGCSWSIRQRMNVI